MSQKGKDYSSAPIGIRGTETLRENVRKDEFLINIHIRKRILRLYSQESIKAVARLTNSPSTAGLKNECESD